MRSLDTIEAASKDYETASRLLTELSKAEALHLDRLNLARLYVLSQNGRRARPRYRDATQASSRSRSPTPRTRRKATKACWRRSRSSIRPPGQWRLDVGDPMVEAGEPSPEMLQRARDLATSDARHRDPGGRPHGGRGSADADLRLAEGCRARSRTRRWHRRIPSAWRRGADGRLSGADRVVAVAADRAAGEPDDGGDAGAGRRRPRRGGAGGRPPRRGRPDGGGGARPSRRRRSRSCGWRPRPRRAAGAPRRSGRRRRRARPKRTARTQVAIAALGEGLDRLAQGDLMHRIEAPFPDKLDKLRADFNARDRASCSRRCCAVAASAGAIRSGAGEISSAADDLSRRTEQQAASLEETAAALDEITATVQQDRRGRQPGPRGRRRRAKSDAETQRRGRPRGGRRHGRDREVVRSRSARSSA